MVAPKNNENALTIHDADMMVDPPVMPPAFGPPSYAIQVFGTLYGEADDGKIVEQGNHTKLVSKNGIYKTMWENQI